MRAIPLACVHGQSGGTCIRPPVLCRITAMVHVLLSNSGGRSISGEGVRQRDQLWHECLGIVAVTARECPDLART